MAGDRYEPRPLVLYGRLGWVPWDLKHGRESEQPGLPHSRWSPSLEAVEGWIRRQSGSNVDELPQLDPEDPGECGQVIQGRRGLPALPGADRPPVHADRLAEPFLG